MAITDPLTPTDLSALSAAIGSQVTWTLRLDTGQSAITDVLRRTDHDDEVVLRRHGDWATTHDPGVARRESKILLAVRNGGVPVPLPIWCGELAGRPCLVTERVVGSARLGAADPAGYGEQLADTLIAIHQIDLPDSTQSALRVAPPGPVGEVDIPRLLLHPNGQDLLDLRRRLAANTDGDGILIHGDYHPGNILWHHGDISAVLDWEAARFGDPAADVAYCVIELRLLGQDSAADALIARYRSRSGNDLPSLPYWTVTALCRSVGELDSIVTSWRSTDPAHTLLGVRQRRDALVVALIDRHR